jgi:hypothetical protein
MTPLSQQILTIPSQENTTPNLRNQTASLGSTLESKGEVYGVIWTQSFLDPDIKVQQDDQ